MFTDRLVDCGWMFTHNLALIESHDLLTVLTGTNVTLGSIVSLYVSPGIYNGNWPVYKSNHECLMLYKQKSLAADVHDPKRE